MSYEFNSTFGLQILGEFLGTLVLVLIGNGACASNNFKNALAKKNGSSWLLIAVGWGLAISVGVIIANAFRAAGAINPAATIFFYISDINYVANIGGKEAGIFTFQAILIMIVQLLGAMLAQVLLYSLMWNHVKENFSAAVKGAACTGPAAEKTLGKSFGIEFIGTLLLLGVVWGQTVAGVAVGPLWPSLYVLVGVLCLGSVTGFAINPARDLGPRIVYYIITKMKFKDLFAEEADPVKADFKYGFLVPILAPMLAGIALALFAFIPNIHIVSVVA